MDSIILYPPGGGSPPAPTSIQLGSWLQADPGPDFGAQGLIQSLESQNALTDGGRFSYRYAPPRHMSIPLGINAQYGVNRLVNPDFETGLIGGLLVAGVATLAAVASPGGAFNGTYYLQATAGVASNAGGVSALVTFQVPVNSLPTNTPMLLAGRFKNNSPTIGAAGPAWLMCLETPAFTNIVEPDSAAPGYIFGAGLGLPQVLNTGNFVGMTLMPNASQYYTIGGIISPQGMASIMGAGSALSNVQVAFCLANGVQPSSVPGASYLLSALDACELRTADRQRAIREWEAQIREYTTPGAFISVQPEGVPTNEAVFFDVLDGRWEPAYNLYENRAAYRKGALQLDTQPFGYWPTEILLASSASVGNFGQLAVNGASLIGDMPPKAHVIISPTTASNYDSGTGWMPDLVAFSFGGAPSFSPFIAPSQMILFPGNVGSLLGDQYAPASQAWMTSFTGPAGSVFWENFIDSATFISSAMEPAYRGRYRVFALARSSPSSAPWQLTVDADRFVPSFYPALASSNQIASVYNAIPSIFSSGSIFTASLVYGIHDMGELTLPPSASGLQQGDRLRVWWGNPSIPAGASYQIFIGGLFLHPVEQGGILTKGLRAPTHNWNTLNPQPGATTGALEIKDPSVRITLSGATTMLTEALHFYRGVLPQLGATTSSMTLLMGDRYDKGINVATYPVANGNIERAAVSVSYRPSFQFLYGL